MDPKTASPQHQQQPYPAGPFAGAPGYGGPSPQPMVINIQQNASAPDKKHEPPPVSPPLLAAPAPVQPDLSQKASREIITFCNFIFIRIFSPKFQY